MHAPDHRLQAEETRRRSFLKSAVNGIAAFFAFAVVAAGFASLLPGQGSRRNTRFFPLIDEDDAPRRGARIVPFTYLRDGREVDARVILARSPEGLLALSPSCTHLGCLVVWRPETGEFACPCHGGRYDIAGRNIEGPPPAPLTRFALKREGGTIFVEMPL